MLDGDWLTSKDGKSRAKARAVIDCRPLSVAIKAAANGETSVAFPQLEESTSPASWTKKVEFLGFFFFSFLVSLTSKIAEFLSFLFL